MPSALDNGPVYWESANSQGANACSVYSQEKYVFRTLVRNSFAEVLQNESWLDLTGHSVKSSELTATLVIRLTIVCVLHLEMSFDS